MPFFSNNEFPLIERLEIGFLLATVGGFLDAYTFICYGGVFANAQTGNMVLLGIAIIKGDLYQFFVFFIPILFFCFGILMTEYLIKHLKRNFVIICTVIELILLFMVGFTPNYVPDFIITALISFICSIQMAGFKKMCGTPYSSTMCTGNLRSAMEYLYHSVYERNRAHLVKSLRYFSVIIFFCFGAFLGALSSLWMEKQSVFICCLFLMVLLGLLIYDNFRLNQNKP